MSLTEIRMVPRRGLLLMVGLGFDEEILLKARLPAFPSHPRAAITVLEGLALWSGRKLPVALGVTASSASSIEGLLPDGPAWNSPLVDLHLVDHPRRRRKTRIEGVGDLREALQLRLPVIA
jgi:hypothetical protein